MARWLARVGGLARFSYESVAPHRPPTGTGRRISGENRADLLTASPDLGYINLMMDYCR